MRDSGGDSLSQQHYITQVLENFGMSSSKPVTTHMCEGALKDIVNLESSLTEQKRYQELVGCLLFISTRTRPDIAAAVSILCRYSSRPTEVHFMGAKRILRYPNGNKNFISTFVQDAMLNCEKGGRITVLQM